MKFLALGALALLVAACSGGGTSGAENEVIAAVEGQATAISFVDFVKALKEQTGGDHVVGTGCAIDLAEQKDGLRITVGTDEDPDAAISLAIPSSSSVKRESRAEDNASTDRFVVDGLGEVRLLLVDDAYYELTLMNGEDATATCEVDF
jgi:hypothetical protein